MPVPFLSSITLNKNEVQDFKVFNYAGDVTPLTGTDIGYFWTNTTGGKTLRWWDGAAVRTILDSASTTIVAADLSGGAAGSLPYQLTAGDTTFLGIGTADQVLKVNSGATAPEWVNQSSLSVGSATNKTGGAVGDLLVQSGSSTTSFLNVGTAGQVLTSNGLTPAYVNQSTLSVGSATTATSASTATNVSGGAAGQLLYQSGLATTAKLGVGTDGYILTYDGTNTRPKWSASIPAGSVSGLAASATTDTTNAANITSGLLPLARLALATGQFYLGDASNNPSATAKSSISLTGFGALTADLDIAGFNIINSGNVTSGSPGSTLATKGYVDSVAQGLDIKSSCLVASTADINLSAPGSGFIDGINPTTFTSGTTRILVKDQSLSQQNGIYIWNGAASAMTRSLDANTWDELVGAFTFIETGSTNADSGWVCTADAGGTLGTTPVPFVKFSQAGSYTAGNGMVLSGGVFHFAQDTNYTAGRIPFASSTSAIGFNANLNWDNTNSRLGIGTASPAYPLSVSGRISYSGAIGEGADATLSSSGTVLLHGNSATWTEQRHYIAGVERYRLSSSGATWYSAASGTQLTLDSSGNLGLGVTPSAWKANTKAIQLGPYGNSYSTLFSDDSGYTNLGCNFFVNSAGTSAYVAAASAGSFRILGKEFRWLQSTSTPVVGADVAFTQAMTLDASGNLGLGVTPSAFSSSFRAVELSSASLMSANDGSAAFFAANTYFNASSQWIYKGNGKAAIYQISNDGLHTWYNSGATSGTGATSYSPIQRMLLDASGNLGIGVVPIGQAKFELGGSTTGQRILFSNTASNTVARTMFTIGYRSAATSAYGYDPIVCATETQYDDSYGLKFYSGPTSAIGMHLSYQGRLGIGMADSMLNRVQIQGAGQTVTSVADSGDGSALFLSDTGVGANNGGLLLLGSASANGQRPHGGIKTVLNDATAYGTADMIFVTRTTTAATTLSEKMRLTKDGNVLVGVATKTAGGAGNVDIRGGLTLSAASATVGGYQQIDFAAGAYTKAAIRGHSTGTTDAGELSFRTAPAGDIVYERLRIKSTGQLNLTGLAADPTGAAGDLYYSTGNVLKMHNGTAWQQLSRKFSGALSGTGTSFTVTHNLGTRDVTVQVRKSGSTYDLVYTDIQMATTDTVTVVFASSVTGSDYTVTVIG